MQQAILPLQLDSTGVRKRREAATRRVDGTEVWRPIQYLGSKLRLLDQLGVHFRMDHPGVSIDLFSGSSVVSQFLALRGPVMGVDSSDFSSVLFNATVRHSGEPVDRLVELASEPRTFEDGPTPLETVREERAAIRRRDPACLLALYRRENQEFNDAYRTTTDWWRSHVEGRFPHILEAHFGGHYFGFGQARDLDWLRHRILSEKDEAIRSVGMAALLATASSLVASAGKHFAQPLNFLEGESNAFVKSRLLSDRSLDPSTVFLSHLRRFASLTGKPHGNGSRHIRAELPEGLNPVEGVDLVYADPPYTPDEYSRFYHLLNVMVRSEPFQLTTVRGIPTKGRYPSFRAPSKFCDRGEAPAAFRELVRRVSRLDSRFVLSYSAGREQGSRDRTMDLADLTSICSDEYERVTTLPLDHTYRPLQPRSRLAPSATEFVLVCD